MINLSQRLIFLLVLLIFIFIQKVNGQQDTSLDFTEGGSSFTLFTHSTTMPAQAYLDLKIEEGFHFQNNRYMLSLYCVIQNLFNSKIIYKVYRYTGQPDDNGYLSAPESQKEISEALSEESYRYLYANYINDPRNYGLPRRTTFGISFSF
jgi:hypothetical protein